MTFLRTEPTAGLACVVCGSRTNLNRTGAHGLWACDVHHQRVMARVSKAYAEAEERVRLELQEEGQRYAVSTRERPALWALRRELAELDRVIALVGVDLFRRDAIVNVSLRQIAYGESPERAFVACVRGLHAAYESLFEQALQLARNSPAMMLRPSDWDEEVSLQLFERASREVESQAAAIRALL